MSNLTERESKLNEMTRQGQILEALSEFYADDATFQEGNQPVRVGKEAQRQHLSAFFQSLKSFNSASLRSHAVGEGVTLSEWTFDMTGPDGPIVWNEVLRRVWRDGKVVSERFYTAS